MSGNNNEHNSDYVQLKGKLLSRTAVVMALAFVIVLVLYFLFWRQRGGNLIVDLLQYFAGMEEGEAIDFYWTYVRSYAPIIWVLSFFVMFLVLMRAVLNHFIDYFDRVNGGIAAILDERAEIKLPSELSATERKLREVQGELKQRTFDVQLAEQRKNDLVMYLAHDIRTPLTSVIGYLNLLEEAPDMPSEQKAKYIGITLEKAYRLEHMVDEFFEITKYNLRQISISKEPIDLYYMLVQLTDEFTPMLRQNGNTIELIAPEELTVFGDPDKLARVLNNVLKNAVSYSFADSPIRITAEKEGDCIHIVFTNQGPSLPAERLEDIFEKFYRMDVARGSHSGGSGLGLAIAREIVTLHGGTISAQCEGNDISFHISLPAAPPDSL